MQKQSIYRVKFVKYTFFYGSIYFQEKAQIVSGFLLYAKSPLTTVKGDSHIYSFNFFTDNAANVFAIDAASRIFVLQMLIR